MALSTTVNSGVLMTHYHVTRRAACRILLVLGHLEHTTTTAPESILKELAWPPDCMFTLSTPSGFNLLPRDILGPLVCRVDVSQKEH
jgi:hypothetical protein